MNERAKALVNAPGSVCPQTSLTDTRAIRRALRGNNYGVYCVVNDEIFKVADTRMDHGVLLVKTVYGRWKRPDRVYVEG